MSIFIGKCPYCFYLTDIKCNLKRHLVSKHKNNITKEANVEVSEKNVEVSKMFVEVPETNVEIPKYQCYKCNKLYKIKKSLIDHEKKCNGVDELTCSRCMKSFFTRSAKSHHIKRNTCKPRSIIYARTPNIQNITNNNTNNTTNNIVNNNIDNSITNNTNIYVNNYGDERSDYLTKERIFKFLLSGNNTLPLYIEDKHFNKDFPENNNIKYTNGCKCLMKEKNVWKEKDLTKLSERLIKDNSKILLFYYNDNKLELENEICNEEILENIQNKLFIIYNNSDNEKYNNLLVQIKDLIKSSNV